MMNAYIKQLSAQATRIEEPNGLFPREVFDREKFADALVNDLLDVLVEYGVISKDGEYYRDVKQRYGVE